MIDFKVELPNTREVKGDIQKKLQRALQKSMYKMEELTIKNAPSYRGLLRQQIKVSPQVLSNSYTLTSGAPYSGDIEFGNSPKFVKFNILLEWVKRKGIRISEGEQFAFARYVQQKIRREGVNAQPFMRPAFYEVRDRWAKIFIKEEF